MKAIFYTGELQTSCLAHILKEIYIDGVYRPFLEGKRDLVIVDAGANIGITSAYFAPFAAQVIAVEPHPEHAACIRQMCEHSALQNVHLCQMAIAGESGDAQFFEFPGNATMGTMQPGTVGWRQTFNVSKITLPELMNKYGLTRIDFLKLDIEGGEADLLRSESFASVASQVSVIVGEWHGWSDISRVELVSRLQALGYRVAWPRGVEVEMFSAIRQPRIYPDLRNYGELS